MAASRLVHAEIAGLVLELEAFGVEIGGNETVEVGLPLAYHALERRPSRPPLSMAVSTMPAGVLVPLLLRGEAVGIVDVDVKAWRVNELSVGNETQYWTLIHGRENFRAVSAGKAEIRPVRSMVDFVLMTTNDGAERVLFCGTPQGMYRKFAIGGQPVRLMHSYTGKEAVEALSGL